MCCMWERVMVSCSWGLNGTRCRAVHVKAAVLCAACGDKQHVEVERERGGWVVWLELCCVCSACRVLVGGSMVGSVWTGLLVYMMLGKVAAGVMV